MVMSDANSKVAAIIVRNGQWIADSATQIWQAQWASAASMARNEKEQIELEKIGNSVQYTISNTNNSVCVQKKQFSDSPFQDVIEQGLSGLLSGGHGGIVTEPDGSTRMSKVPDYLQGQDVDFLYGRPADPVSEGIDTINSEKIPEWLNEEFNDSKSEIANRIIKPEIIKELQTVLQGSES